MANQPSSLKPEELRAQIAETRNEMGATIEELHGRLNPVVFKDKAMEQFHEAAATVKLELKAHLQDAKAALKSELAEAKEHLKSEITQSIDHTKAAVREATIGKVEHMVDSAKTNVRAAGRSVVDVVKENPVPVALVGVGLAWLFVSTRRARADQQRQLTAGYEAPQPQPQQDGMASRAMHGVGDAVSAGGHKIAGAAQAVGHKVADVATTAGSAVGRAAASAGHGINAAAHKVGGAAVDVAHGAADGARVAKDKVTSYYEINPLAFGVAALAVGTAIGLAMPRTAVENLLLGPTRDQVVDRAQELAHEAMGKANEMAEHLTDNVKQSLTAGDGQQQQPGGDNARTERMRTPNIPS